MKTTHLQKVAVSAAVASALVGMMVVAVGASAATRTDRTDRGSTDTTIPSPAPTPAPPSYTDTGGISSTVSGVVDTGGNTGGTVTTGDKSATVYQVNIGPTNSNSGVTTPAPDPVPPAPACDSSRSRCTDARTR